MGEVWMKLSKVMLLKLTNASSIHVLVVVIFIVLSAVLMLDLLNLSSKMAHMNKDNDEYSHKHGQTRGIKEWKNIRRSVGTEPLPYLILKDIVNIDTIPVREPTCAVNSILMILVTSAPDHFDRRRAIRNTWAKDRKTHNDSNWQTFFLIGNSRDSVKNRKIEDEFYEYGDILLGDYIDTYRNLTLKVQNGFKWAVENCQPQYLLKTDDDCYVNTRYFPRFLDQFNPNRDGLYAGAMFNDRGVVRDKNSKWYVSPEDYPMSVYPRYASGTGYVLSKDVLQRVVEAFSEVHPFPVEDAYTGVVVHRVGVSMLDTGRFTMYNKQWRICNYLYLLVIHGVTPEQQYLALKYTDDTLVECPGQKESVTWY
ncbi:beta-1,3-galactosyltransferase 1-like [Saccoglossus kowalevskii]|uniref:Hexosyltransferase n=1 Tax=Saccoglossus kowalevskii TaxID=10224 RepID=A0ABM0N1E1_SACKO|nr:PREDICTED: beta-1,3-galactosyltransferase 1-like [Saccoglossus kowalevskii]